MRPHHRRTVRALHRPRTLLLRARLRLTRRCRPPWASGHSSSERAAEAEEVATSAPTSNRGKHEVCDDFHDAATADAQTCRIHASVFELCNYLYAYAKGTPAWDTCTDAAYR